MPLNKHAITTVLLPSLPVSDDELTLSTANGDQTVHGFDASLHWLPHRDAGDDARGFQTHTPPGFGAKRTLGRNQECHQLSTSNKADNLLIQRKSNIYINKR